MGAISRNELEAAFAHYCEVNDKASATGDWSGWASKFSEDCVYIEHAFGEFHYHRRPDSYSR